jgi:hypothetical protein
MEAVGLDEDLDAMGQKDTSDGRGQDSEQEEDDEEEGRRVCGCMMRGRG